MRIRRLCVAATIVTALGLSPAPATADGCGIVTQIGPFYVDDRTQGVGGIPDVWIYLESNGEPGLQIGGESPTGLYDDEGCHVDSNPDQLIL